MSAIRRYLVLIVIANCGLLNAVDRIDLSGNWSVALDRKDVGVAEEWFAGALPGGASLMLPGSLQSQGYGDKPSMATEWVGGIRYDEWEKSKYDPYKSDENFKIPFWLQPDRTYMGAAWYQKTVVIPESWAGKRVVLSLERAHWGTQLWLNDAYVGERESLSVAHEYDLSRLVVPGQHTLTLRVDNRILYEVGINAHSVSDHTQTNWNGVIGGIEVWAESPIWIEDLQAYPDLSENELEVVVDLKSIGFEDEKGELYVELVGSGSVLASEVRETKGHVDRLAVSLALPEEVALWDEFNPELYTVRTVYRTSQGKSERSARIGLREIRVEGNRILVNGNQVSLRGTLECAIFPKTGYPSTDVEEWKRIIRICKEHGLNHMRFHSWCPPKAAFEAADELGFYLQVECGAWANQGATIGDGNPVDRWLYDEAERILEAYGNHPSFIMLGYGNEPSGPGRGGDFLKSWISHFRAMDTRRLFTGGAGWPKNLESHYHVTGDDVRDHNWGSGLGSRINSKKPDTLWDFSDGVEAETDHPLVAHETGQWCVYPNFDEIEKYDGLLKAKNFEVFQDLLRNKGLLNQAEAFLQASGKLQVLCYKEDIEASLRTPNLGGFQLLDLHDFPGQGTAPVGVLDPFWDPKGYVTAEEYSRFCGPTVPLARLPSRTYTDSETLRGRVDLYHFGESDLLGEIVTWTLQDQSGRVFREGSFEASDYRRGGVHQVGGFEMELNDLPAPMKYILDVQLRDARVGNDWDLWVYPSNVDTEPKDILVSNSLNPEVQSFLKSGGSVLLSLDPRDVATEVDLGFSPIYWNTAWTERQAPHTLGILCDPDHPALAEFPTEFHSNWQWSDIIRSAAAMQLERLPADVDPIVQVVPDWFEPEMLAIAFEVKVGTGKLLVTSFDLSGDLDGRPVEQQFLKSLFGYMTSGEFEPKASLSWDALWNLVTTP
ncbi:sugar-binding domain-containing protein [Pelagicoccus mobilis]|uniref:beta-galactosidase n=1 Tax=Pelagicoccus mobilis TaxID=415221 RepID=A0A934RY54_9BACT|nr:sugar-binding domain-containing protein [Pelagicoccus mobilis]MBK1878726.1 hypothetical protein [Pelagicoccus mobilis]